MLEIGAQHHIEQSHGSTGDILLVSLHQLRKVKAAIPASLRYVGLALLDPEVGPRIFSAFVFFRIELTMDGSCRIGMRLV